MPTVERGILVDGAERHDPIERVRQSVAPGQRVRERPHQGPAQQRRDRQSGDQGAERRQDGAFADPCVELTVRRQQEHQRERVDEQSEVDVRAVPPRHAQVVGQRRHEIERVGRHEQDQVDDADPPGDPLAGRERDGDEGEHERPGEAGVGEGDDVVVDVAARVVDQMPNRGEETGQQRDCRQYTDDRAGDVRGAGPEPGGPSDLVEQREGPAVGRGGRPRSRVAVLAGILGVDRREGGVGGHA